MGCGTGLAGVGEHPPEVAVGIGVVLAVLLSMQSPLRLSSWLTDCVGMACRMR
jgi:hypothetical protein